MLIFSGVVGYVIIEQNGQNANPVQRLAAQTSTSIPASLQTPRTTATVQYVLLDSPIIGAVSYKEKADGTSSYTVAAQVVNQTNQPIHTSGITAKIWLTHDEKVNNNLPTNRLISADTLAQSFPGETVGAFIFNSSTPQTQLTNANGQATWQYTISASIKPGTYYIVVLCDWDGIHYNWSFFKILIS